MIMLAILTQVVQNMIRTQKVHPKTLTQKTMYKMTDTIKLRLRPNGPQRQMRLTIDT